LLESLFGQFKKRSSANFASSAVPGVLEGLVEMIAESFRPLLCPLPRHAYLPLFYAFFVVGNVPEFPELRAGLCVQYGLQRFFDGLPTPGSPVLRLAHQDLVGHLFDASIVAHGSLLFLAETLPKGLRCSPKLPRTLCCGEAEPLPEN